MLFYKVVDQAWKLTLYKFNRALNFQADAFHYKLNQAFFKSHSPCTEWLMPFLYAPMNSDYVEIKRGASRSLSDNPRFKALETQRKSITVGSDMLIMNQKRVIDMQLRYF